MTRGSHHEKIVEYLEYGWPLGHDGITIPQEAKRNHKGVLEFHEETKQYLWAEKAQSRVYGPHKSKRFVGKNGISPLNSVPRKNDEKRRFILDLSFPKQHGINDGINKDFYEGEEVTLRYPTVDDLVNLIYDRKQKHPNEKILLWKRDLKSCYRQFQLCPGSVHLVGYKFEEEYWYDLVLAMGSTSSAQICQKITNLVRYIFENRYDDEVRNFLDDFFSAQIESEAANSYQNLMKLLQTLGIEENLKKACPPAESMVVLGILFCTVSMTLSLSQEKTQEIIAELNAWKNRDSCSLKQMQSLVGKLSFAAGVVRSGRVFMSRLINMLRIKKNESINRLKLNDEARSDIQWWKEQIKLREGVPMSARMINKTWEPPGSVWSSDSSKTGLGGWSEGTAHFFHHKLSEDMQKWDINALEGLSLLLCLRKWIDQGRGKRVLIYCDNQNSVLAVNSGASRNRILQACLREIYHICALNSTEIKAIWLKTSDNDVADALSRWDQHPKFPAQFFRLTRDRNIQETVIEPADLEFIHTTL